MSRLLTMHVGLPKTGTTTLQHALTEQEGLLASYGVFYARVGRAPHAINAVVDVQADDALCWRRQTPALKVQVQTMRQRERHLHRWERLVSRARGAGGDVVISAENLVYSGPVTLQAIAESFEGYHRRVVVSVRPPSVLVAAMYAQLSKVDRLPDFEQWTREALAAGLSSSNDHPLFWVNLAKAVAAWDEWADETVVVNMTREPSAAFSELWGAVTGGVPAPVAEPLRNPRLSASLVDACQRVLATTDLRSALALPQAANAIRDRGRLTVDMRLQGSYEIVEHDRICVDAALGLHADENGQQALAERLTSREPLTELARVEDHQGYSRAVEHLVKELGASLWRYRWRNRLSDPARRVVARLRTW